MIRWLPISVCAWIFSGACLANPDALSPSSIRSALDAVDRAPRQGHPRVFAGQADYKGIVAAAFGERVRGLDALKDSVRRHSIQTGLARRALSLTALDSAARLNDWFKMERELERTAESAFVWYAGRDPWFLAEVRSRFSAYAPRALDTGCQMELAQARFFAWYFALAYDLAYAGLTESERETARSVVSECVAAHLDETIGALRRNARDGVAFHSLARFVGALTVMYGEIQNARVHLEPALEKYLADLSPWGGDDGGYANGVSYALWDIGGSLLSLDLIERVLKLPVYSHPWVTEFQRFLTYTTPPGAPAGAFGDGAEVYRKEEWARFGKAISSRYDTDLARWYERQLFGEDPARLELLLSPPRAASAATVPDDADAAFFPSIGWAAMHSALVDRSRVSVYFKSSPYGSLNHGHADQNSFVIHARGHVLAMDSGYYDYYNSPHWRDWYKQTRAHNTITFDGGIGQILGSDGRGDAVFSGALTSFQTSAGYDVVTGDATAAYGGALDSAIRTVVFLRPSTVVVIDQLESEKPRRWEWNLHTPGALMGEGQSRFRMSIGDAEMCIQVGAPDGVALESENGYNPPPARDKVSPHFWNRFKPPLRKSNMYFAAVMRMNCNDPAATIDFVGGRPVVSWNGRTIKYSGATVVVQ